MSKRKKIISFVKTYSKTIARKTFELFIIIISIHYLKNKILSSNDVNQLQKPVENNNILLKNPDQDLKLAQCHIQLLEKTIIQKNQQIICLKVLLDQKIVEINKLQTDLTCLKEEHDKEVQLLNKKLQYKRKELKSHFEELQTIKDELQDLNKMFEYHCYPYSITYSYQKELET